MTSETATDVHERRGPGRTRMCALTREVRPEAELIRFVAAPDGSVVADIRARLPGRGVWVGRDRKAVAEAVRKNVFARSLKAPVKPAADLADQVAARLREAALGRLGLARKAGAVVAGFAKVEAAITRGDLAGAGDRFGRGGGRPPQDRAGRPSPLRRGGADARYPLLRVGGIGFGNGPAKCDTCCRASEPVRQEFRGSGHPLSALRERCGWPGARYSGQAAGYDG